MLVQEAGGGEKLTLDENVMFAETWDRGLMVEFECVKVLVTLEDTPFLLRLRNSHGCAIGMDASRKGGSEMCKEVILLGDRDLKFGCLRGRNRIYKSSQAMTYTKVRGGRRDFINNYRISAARTVV